MKCRGLRYLAAVLACTMLFSMLPAHAMAQQDDTQADTGVEIGASAEEQAEEPAGGQLVADFAEDMPSNDELFAGYVQQLFYPELATATYADYASRSLSSAEHAVYAALKVEVAKIAAGERASTIISIPNANIDQNSLAPIYYCLLYDCTYELYWHDKTQGCYLYETQDGALQWWFTVAEGYANADVTQLEVTQAVPDKDWNAKNQEEFESAKKRCYTINTAKAQSTLTAKANAEAIVAKYASLDDREKLTAYKDAICALTSYNEEAVSTEDATYGDPWQMIYVFDEDDSTNVVCEGYAKAFQYLCDQSKFEDETVRCYTVSGTMYSIGADGISGGAHMWNIVTLGGKNYLVDVTNSDEGTIGVNGGLFLAEGRGNVRGGYTFYPDGYWTKYVYDAEMLELYDASVLRLAGTQVGTENYPAAQNTKDGNNLQQQKADTDDDSGTLLLVCGAAAVGVAAVATLAYLTYFVPVTCVGVAGVTGSAAMPNATVRLLRGERVLATAQADASGNYRLTARGADTLEMTYTDPETGETVTTRKSLKTGLMSELENGLENELGNGLETGAENASTATLAQAERQREAA